MTVLMSALSAALLHLVWQGPLVALLLWVALAALRNGTAHVRYILSCAALAIMVALPLLTFAVVYRAPSRTSQGVTQLVNPAQFPSAGNSSPDLLAAWLASLEAWTVPVWCAGVLIFAVRLIWSSRHVARLRRTGNPPVAAVLATVSRLAQRMQIGGPVRVLITSLTDTPSVAGWLRPVILLPAATLLNLSVEQLETILAHELAHIRRHDYLVNLLQTLAETLFFYQPAVWWASAQIRREREFCCDDLVVETCGSAANYARALMKLEGLRDGAPALAMSSTAGPLLYRIRRLAGTVDEQAASKMPALLALGVALVCIAVNLPWASAQPQTETEVSVRKEAIWVDTVKFGELPIMVRALGTLATPGSAELQVAASQAKNVQLGQPATIELRPGITAAGRVSRIDSYATTGTVTVAVELQTAVPEFAGRAVDGIIRIRTLSNVMYVGRPVTMATDVESLLFKLEPDGTHARRVKVRFGAPSINTVQVLEGLQPGDRVILSDTAKLDGSERIRVN